MADEMNKDVVAARLNLDTSKMLQSFKVIDEGARGNAESFKLLNVELTTTAKNYATMAAAADKLALTSEERKNKVLAESEALVKQRTAQTELLNAKKNQLDQNNQVIEAKLQAQQAIVKKREDAIEQQEREHQQKMFTLQQKTSAAESQAQIVETRMEREQQILKAGQAKIEQQELEHQQRMATLQQRTAKASSEDNLMQARLDREFQIIKNSNAKEEREEELHATKMLKLNQQINNSMNMMDHDDHNMDHGGILDNIKQAALHATVFSTVYKGIETAQEMLKEGIVDIESNMAGYVQTNEKYFLEYNEGTKEMQMNTEKLHDQTVQFIQTTHDLGSEIDNVTESARLWGRMYKDVNVVQELVRQSTKLSTVDLVDLEDSTKGMEAVMAQYGVQVKNANDAMVIGNRVLDSWSKVAHETMAPAQDLTAAFERTGKVAAETGVSFDFMNGLISSGVRNTALSGENLGNMWKTVLGTIRTDKAVKEIESLGVATKEVVNGTEQWRKAEDIILDLSTKVVDKNYDLTKSYEDISRGVYQYAKLAASLNTGDILLGTAASIGSTGSTTEYLQVQLDTIQRKAAATKASLLEIFNAGGDDGLRSSIKATLDVIDQLLIGLANIPPGIYKVVGGATALLVAIKAISKPLSMLKTAVDVLKASKVADTAATATNTAANEANTVSKVQNTAATSEEAIATKAATVETNAMTAAQAKSVVTTALATAGISVLLGVLATLALKYGASTKAARDHAQELKDQDSVSQQLISQYQRQEELLPKLVTAHNNLQAALDKGTLSTDKQTQVKKQLAEISQALVMTLGDEGAAELERAGYTDEATKKQIAALDQLIAKQKETRKNVLADQQDDISKQIEETGKAIDETEKKISKASNNLLSTMGEYFKNALSGKDIEESGKVVEGLQTKLEGLKQKNNELQASAADLNVQMAELNVNEDDFSGKAGVATESVEDQQQAFSELQDTIQNNGSAISELNGLLNDLADGQSLNAANAVDLILKYPELTDKVYKAADGWKFEKDAVEVLRKAKIQKAIDDLKSEQTSAFNTKAATDERLEAYGIEAEAIKNLADLKSKLNGTLTDSTQTGEDLKYFKPQFQEQGKKVMAAREAAQSEIDSIISDYDQQAKDYETKIKNLTALYNDPKFGISSSSGSKKSSSGSSSKDDPNQKSFDASQKWIDHQKALGQLSDEQELAAWERIQSRYAKGSEQRMKADEQVYSLKKKLIEDNEEKEKEAYDASMKWIDHQKATRDVSATEELSMLERVQARYTDGSEERMELDEKVYAAKKAAEQESFSNSEKWIEHQKAIGNLSAEQEIKAWERVQAKYKEGSEQRMEADEKVYSLKKQLLKDEQSSVEKSAKKYSDNIKNILDKSTKAIKTERDEFLKSQQDKINSIDNQIKAMDRLNVEEDYERQLAEKQARLDLLQSAVGPEGIAERKQIQKDIEDMQREHDRDLAKQSLEDQKQQLSDEKDQKEKDYNDQIQALKDHYDEMSTAFDSYSSDLEISAENLKQIQVLKESEKNAEILAQLDQFIADYQAKLSKISGIGTPEVPSPTDQSAGGEKDQDLTRYNANVDTWYDNNSTIEEKSAAHAENESLRKKYGIVQDPGGHLQHFKGGGIVKGVKSQPVPVVAHAGEMYINEQQQKNLFKLLNFNIPKLNFTMPDFSLPTAVGQNTQQNGNVQVTFSGDTYIEDESTARVFWSEKDNFLRRMQARGGGKG